jgi:hypothetical protein
MASVYWQREEMHVAGARDEIDETDESEPLPRRPLTRAQRWLLALLGTFGIWFLASAALVLVGKLGGDVVVQYVLGALVVLLIPVMLVMLFVMLWPTLRGERSQDEQAVLGMVARDFPAAERPTALALLDDYCLTVPEMERLRVQRALLTLSGGDLARLRYLTAETQQDYEDLLAWADEGATPSSMERED